MSSRTTWLSCRMSLVQLLVIYGKFLLAADGDPRLASGGKASRRRGGGQRVEVRIVDSHAGE